MALDEYVSTKACKRNTSQIGSRYSVGSYKKILRCLDCIDLSQDKEQWGEFLEHDSKIWVKQYVDKCQLFKKITGAFRQHVET